MNTIKITSIIVREAPNAPKAAPVLSFDSIAYVEQDTRCNCPECYRARTIRLNPR